MQPRNPHTEDYDVVWHVHYIDESDHSTRMPHAIDVVMYCQGSSLTAIAERIAKLTNRPYGSIRISGCYVKGYK